ncbi:ferritin-like domain-containing protein, partial [Streptococcus thermophilus]
MTDSIKETIKETVNHQAETPTNTKTKAVLNQAVADLSVAASIVHQVHWYMRGPGFLYLHPKMDELMDSLNSYLDKISERLITI